MKTILIVLTGKLKGWKDAPLNGGIFESSMIEWDDTGGGAGNVPKSMPRWGSYDGGFEPISDM